MRARDEIATVVRERKTRLLLLGLVLSPLSLMPIVNILVLPIYAGIAFTELCLVGARAVGARVPACAPA